MTSANGSAPPEIDKEYGTAFDWLGAGPSLWGAISPNEVIERPDRAFCRDVGKMLDSDGGARSLESALTLPLRQATVRVEEPENDRGQTEFVRQVLMSPPEDGGMNTPWTSFLGQCTGAMAFKKAFFEKVWTLREDGRVSYSKLAWRPQSSCEIRRDRRSGEIISFRQYQYDAYGGGTKPAGTDRDGYVNIPPDRAFILTHGTHRDPLYGVSDLEVALWAHNMKQKILLLWLTFLDSQATPALATYGKDENEAKGRARALASLRNGGVVGMIRNDPTESLFDQISSGAGGADQFQEMCRWLDSQASQSILAGWKDLSDSAASGRGSYALSSDLTQLYLASRHGVASEIADQITTGVIAPLVAINFGADAQVPRLVFEKINTAQATLALQMMTTLGSAQNLNIPAEFIDLLVELVAQYLDLPAERTKEIIDQHVEDLQNEREASQALRENNPLLAQTNPAQAAQSRVGDQVNAATAAVAQGQARSPIGNRARPPAREGPA